MVLVLVTVFVTVLVLLIVFAGSTEISVWVIVCVSVFVSVVVRVTGGGVTVTAGRVLVAVRTRIFVWRWTMTSVVVTVLPGGGASARTEDVAPVPDTPSLGLTAVVLWLASALGLTGWAVGMTTGDWVSFLPESMRPQAVSPRVRRAVVATTALAGRSRKTRGAPSGIVAIGPFPALTGRLLPPSTGRSAGARSLNSPRGSGFPGPYSSTARRDG
jgi:hypothetical protein